jgi:hypothetical protein
MALEREREADALDAGIALRRHAHGEHEDGSQLSLAQVEPLRDLPDERRRPSHQRAEFVDCGSYESGLGLVAGREHRDAGEQGVMHGGHDATGITAMSPQHRDEPPARVAPDLG